MSRGAPVFSARDVTPGWVEARLGRSFGLPSGGVTAARVTESFDSCSGRNTRIVVDYSPGATADPPRNLMLRHWREGIGLNEREVRFYAEIAPDSRGTPTVPCYDVAWDEDSQRWHVLLLDISPTHAQAPEPLSCPQRQFLMPDHAEDHSPPRPYPDRTYMSLARAYASLHARWWNDDLISERRHCSSPGGPHCMAGVGPDESVRTIQEHWLRCTLPAYREEHPRAPSSSAWRTCERAAASWGDLLTRRGASGPLTLVQGDSHLGNVFLSRDPRDDHLHLLDWDAYQRGIGPWDLACMLVVSHAPQVRRRVEHAVLRAYHDCLVSDGVSDYSYDRCVADYRLSVLAGLFPPIAWRMPLFLEYALVAFDDWRCSDLL